MLSRELFEGLQQAQRPGGWSVKLKAGGFYTPVKIELRAGRMEFNFSYFQPLIDEIKETFEDRRYHGYIEDDGRKIWSAPITQRNLFRLQYLMGKNTVSPYAHWDKEFVLSPSEVMERILSERDNLEPFKHQCEMISQAYSLRWCIWGAEMGLGKSLSGLLVSDMLIKDNGWNLSLGDMFWVAPLSAIASVKLEQRKWKVDLPFSYLTYPGIVKTVETWIKGRPAPRILIVDESSRCRNPTAQRSIAIKHMADSMRKEYGFDCLILEMSGSPSPKDPTGWYTQCEIACPGFLREQNIHMFKDRMGIFESVESETGGYKKLITWLDDERKCSICGKEKEDYVHTYTHHTPHSFQPSKNEVAGLTNRTRGLVGVWLKEDCLDLPERRFFEYTVQPTQEVLNLAKIIVASTPRAAEALIKLRTLSDGFIYVDKPTGRMLQCPGCNGASQQIEYYNVDDPDSFLTDEEIKNGVKYIYETCPEEEDPIEFIPKIIGQKSIKVGERFVDCFSCEGSGQVEEIKRTITETECPKDAILYELLEKHEESGRFNVYAGFQGSIDRVQKLIWKKGWHVIKADGRGWTFTSPKQESIHMKVEDMLWEFQYGQEKYKKIVFLGQPGAAGMGITLHASLGTFFFSNDFNPESRIQTVDRIHRIGMDKERGGWIYDIIHLPSDKKVLDSLKESRRLELLSMDALRRIYNDKNVRNSD